MASFDVIYRMSPDWKEMHQLDGRGFMADLLAPSSPWLETSIMPDDQAEVSAAVAEAVHIDTPFELEHRVRLADGCIGWTSSRTIPLRDEQGRVAERVGAAHDETAHKKADAALHQSEESN